MLNDSEKLSIYSFKENKYFFFYNGNVMIDNIFIEIISKENDEFFLLINSKIIKTSLDVAFVFDDSWFLLLNRYTIFYSIEKQIKCTHNGNFFDDFFNIFFNRSDFCLRFLIQDFTCLKYIFNLFIKINILSLFFHCYLYSDKLSYENLNINEEVLMKTAIKKYFITHSDSNI